MKNRYLFCRVFIKLIVSFISIIVVILLNPMPAPVHAVEVSFEKSYGSSGQESGESVAQTSDGGFVFVGSTSMNEPGGSNIYLVKVDSAGDEVWSKILGGADLDYAECIRKTSDSGFIITGYTQSFGNGDFDMYIIKTDSSGEEEWSTTFGGPFIDIGYAGHQTTDGGYIIAGKTYQNESESDIFVVKTDHFGNEEWNQKFSSLRSQTAFDVQQTEDRGYIVTGSWEMASSGSDLFLLKLHENGDPDWINYYMNIGTDYGRSVQITSDGGYIIGGTTNSFGNDYDEFYVIKTTSTGYTQWSKTYGLTPGITIDRCYSIRETPSGGYIMTGESDQGYISKLYIIKTTADGTVIWDKTFAHYVKNCGNEIQPTSDGGYIVVGVTRPFHSPGTPDAYLIKLDPEYVPALHPFSVIVILLLLPLLFRSKKCRTLDPVCTSSDLNLCTIMLFLFRNGKSTGN